MLSLLGGGIVGRVKGQGRTANQTDASFVQFSCVPFSFQVRVGSLGVSIARPYNTSVVHLSISYWHQRLWVVALCCGRPNVPTPGLPLIEQAPGRTPAVTSTKAGARSVGLPLIIGAPNCRTDPCTTRGGSLIVQHRFETHRSEAQERAR